MFVYSVQRLPCMHVSLNRSLYLFDLLVPPRSSRGEHLLGWSLGSSQQVRLGAAWIVQWRNMKESSNQPISFVIYYSEYYNATTALRQSLVQTYASFFFNLPLALVFSPAQFAVHTQLNLLYQFWIHTGTSSLLARGGVYHFELEKCF